MNVKHYNKHNITYYFMFKGNFNTEDICNMNAYYMNTYMCQNI